MENSASMSFDESSDGGNRSKEKTQQGSRNLAPSTEEGYKTTTYFDL